MPSPRVRTCGSNHIDRVRGHPDVDLSEADFEVFLELAEEFPVFWHVSDIDNYTHGIIRELLALVVPQPPNDFRLPSHGPKPFFELQECFPDDRVGHRLAVIEPQ